MSKVALIGRLSVVACLSLFSLALSAGLAEATVGDYSDNCTAPTTTIIDGYLGSLYAKLAIQQGSPQTLVCARVQQSGGTEAGGELVASSPTQPNADGNYLACSTTPGNTEPFQRSGAIGDPSEPPYVPYLIGDYIDSSNDAWICLRAGSMQERVTVSAASPVSFASDTPASVPVPAHTPWTIGKASTDCETQLGGTLSQLLDVNLGGSQVWLDEWQSSSKVELCVRGQGAQSAGGRLTIDTTGSPGVTPVVPVPSSNVSACTVNVFSDDQDQVYVKRSPTANNPASVCVIYGSTLVQSFTVGYTGSPVIHTPDWTPDS